MATEKWSFDYSVYADAENEAEARRLWDAIEVEVERILCGREGVDHECPRNWTSGGRLSPVSRAHSFGPGDLVEVPATTATSWSLTGEPA